MSVDQKTVRHIAQLARIAVEEQELAPLAGELNGILDWIEQLSEVDTENVAPMTSAIEHGMKMRDDVVTVGNLQAEVTANAPDSDDGFFVVPKVVE